MICPICEKEAETLKAAIVKGEYMTERCSKCVGNFVPPSPYANKWRRDRMKENHRGDLVQAWNGDKPNPEFAKLYPEKARTRFGDKFMETI